MQVEVKFHYNTLVADLSGAELEVFNRIIGKLQMVEGSTTLEGLGEVYPLSTENRTWEVRVNPKPLMLVSAEEAASIRHTAALKRRGELVDLVIAANDATQSARVKDLVQQLWYDSLWTHDEHKNYELVDVGTDFVIVTTLEGKTLKVTNQGVVTTSKG
jgi:hypothetical protein